MKKKIVCLFLCIVMVIMVFPLNMAEADTKTVSKSPPSKVIDFSQWKVAPSANVTSASRPKFATPPANDETAISPGYDTSTWDTIPVPGSLLGGLIDLGKYDDVFAPNNEGKKDVMFDNNITTIPDDFSSAWWYSVDFDLDAADIASFATLTFKGISYTGQVWVNGQEIKHANTDITNENELKNRWTSMPSTIPGYNPQGPYTYTDPGSVSIPSASTVSRGTWDEYKGMMQGSFRHYDLDVTGKLVAGKNNIKVKVTRGDRSNDFNYNFHDWHMTPVCRNMGITYPATLTLTGGVRLSNPFVGSKVALDRSSADVSFYVETTNMSAEAVSGQVTASVRDPESKVVKTFTSGTVTIPAGAYNREISFPVQTFSGSDLQLWWPYMSGDQPLYHVDYTFVPANGAATDSLTHRFGIRQISGEVNKFSTHNNSYMMQVYVNHKPITVRGGGFCPYDLYLRQSALKDQALIDLNKEMGFNAMRDEGKFFNDNLYDLMDENGIMLMTGYMCCDRNEVQSNNWAKAERFIVYEQTYDQIRSLRSHPSMLMWLNGSDYAKDNTTSNVNASNIHHKMLEIEGRLHYYDHGIVMSSASGLNTGGSSGYIGTTGGIEMEHSYDSQSPAFYFASVPATTANSYTGSSFRGVYSFVSEGGGGAGIPTVEGMRRMIPENFLWPMNVGGTVGSGSSGEDPGPYNKWNYHACRGGNNFDKINTFQATTDGAFGGADSIEEWVAQANLYQYDMQRSQYEALSKNRYVSATGFINWMLNGTRPVIMWNQFDYDMNPHGSTYGSGKANEPVHIMYDPFLKEISVINSTFKDYGNLTATMVLYDIAGNVISNPLEKAVNVVADGVPDARVGARINRTVGKVPTTYLGDNWYDGGFQTVSYEYGNTGNTNSSISTAYGVKSVWTRTDISSSLIKPTTDVYFMRLELKDSVGKVVSYNTYAVPRRQDAWAGNSGWMRAYTSQTMDWTQLKALPELEIGKDIAVKVNPHTVDGVFIIQTVELTNNTGSIAHGVELKSFKAQGDTMLCPATYDDNLITLFPGQTRTITVKHQIGYFDGPLYISVNCFNNVIGERVQRNGNIYNISDITNGAVGDTTDSQPTRTTNIARVRQYATNDGSFGSGNATAVASTPQGIANSGTTVMDSDTNTSISITPSSGSGASATGSLTVNLGSAKTFDRTMLRFYGQSGTNMIGGTPNYIRVQVSDTNGDWRDVEVYNNRAGTAEGYAATYDNTDARSPMTNIMLKAPVSAQYIRYTFTGLTLGSTAYGSGAGSVSSQTTAARANPTSFTIGGVEIYNTYNNVFVKFDGFKGTVRSGSSTLTAASDVAERSLKAFAGGKLSVSITPSDPAEYVCVMLNGKFIADNCTKSGAITLSLENIDEYSELTFKTFAEAQMSGFDAESATAIAVVEENAVTLIAGVYDKASGKLVGAKSAVSNVEAPAWRRLMVDLGAFGDLTGKYVRVFVWNSVTYIPIIDALSVNRDVLMAP